MEQTSNAYRIWWRKAEGKRPLERSRRIDKDNIEVGPKKQDGRAGVRFIWRWLGKPRSKEGSL